MTIAQALALLTPVFVATALVAIAIFVHRQSRAELQLELPAKPATAAQDPSGPPTGGIELRISEAETLAIENHSILRRHALEFRQELDRRDAAIGDLRTQVRVLNDRMSELTSGRIVVTPSE